MRTTIDVYPESTRIPTFSEILDLSTAKLLEFLNEYGISGIEYKVNIKLHWESGGRERYEDPPRMDLHSAFLWNTPEVYAWVTVGHFGGVRIDECRLVESDQNYWHEQIQINERAALKQEIISSCLKNSYYWHFVKDYDVNGILKLAYGLVAGSLAQLTGGFIFSKDGAWEKDRLPATAEDFLSWYFRPETITSRFYRDRTEKDFSRIKEGY